MLLSHDRYSPISSRPCTTCSGTGSLESRFEGIKILDPCPSCTLTLRCPNCFYGPFDPEDPDLLYQVDWSNVDIDPFGLLSCPNCHSHVRHVAGRPKADLYSYLNA